MSVLYVDKIEVALFLRNRPSPPHVHPCPGCYTEWPCAWPKCTIEPNLEGAYRLPSGSYFLCKRCRDAGIEAP